MDILFCDNPFDNKKVDPDFEEEFAAAKATGFSTHLFSFESLTKEENAVVATQKIKHSENVRPILYRGWMLKPYQYKLLYNALLIKNYKIINSAIEYQNCHYLPDSYQFIKGHTPPTVWISFENKQPYDNEIFESVKPFGDSALIVKDYVKSQKHYWDTACFIPTASDEQKVKAVVHKFLELQGTDLNEGLVFREFILLQDLTVHSKSKMPLKQEYRLFFFNKNFIGCYDYWEEGEYTTKEAPPIDFFKTIAKKIRSNFFSMDIAKTQSGQWIIIELGDGQVTGLPDKVNKTAFFGLIQSYISSE